jgi:hypothetical protein
MKGEFFPVSTGVHLDIDRARKIIKRTRKRRPRYRTHVPTLYSYIRRRLVRINRKHATTKPLKDEPIIMARVCGVTVCVDGWHRVYRAHRQHKRWISSDVLTDSEANRCAIESKFLRRV